ncbi:BESS motif,MADF domain [Cinara cedri]|uniref:BESS motif,MADF domain n=1 Tax=Cinara cedri TaxID=506608 RepID=A0A5E4N133_9HEMI|nr:BESS motif,MADF domain [Cinara cedri]
MCDESALNIKFVQFVEQYPCLYDFTRDDRRRRNVAEKAWNSIGREFKLSVSSDKDEQDSDTDIITDINLDNSEVPLHDEIPSTLNESFQKRHEDVSQDKFSAPYTTKNLVLHMKTSTDLVDKCFVDYITSKRDSQTNKSNSDLDFFKSLLSDISKMTDYQKRQFKRRILDIIDSILDDSPKQTSISYVQRTLSSYSGSSYSVPSPESSGTPVFQQLENLHSEDYERINNNPKTVQKSPPYLY